MLTLELNSNVSVTSARNLSRWYFAVMRSLKWGTSRSDAASMSSEQDVAAFRGSFRRAALACENFPPHDSDEGESVRANNLLAQAARYRRLANGIGDRSISDMLLIMARDCEREASANRRSPDDLIPGGTDEPPLR